MKKRNMIILLILILTIGFASVSTTLVLNGTIGIGLKGDDFEVIFVEALLDGQESSKATIGSDKKTITFNTDKLTSVGDTTELVYKVKNNSTQYGANVTMTCNTIGNEYVSITSTFVSQPLPLATPVLMEAQEVRMGRITAELIKGYAEENGSINIECKIIASATEDDTIAEYVPNRYREEILNGADPILAKGLVPITIENDGTVKKADITSEWYNYENKKWANAVILEDESVTYNAGEIIPEGNIESYLVWIPRYKYQIFDEGNYTGVIESKPTESNVKEIQIVFENRNVTPSNGSAKDSWLTHPAFTNFDVNGLWVGKFETGYKGATSKEQAQEDSTDSSKIIVKPNVYSWRNSTVANIFKTAYNYKRELDSHMMKNTEWGVVAYLSHSKYGINNEVNINNNSNYLTGYSAVLGTDQSSYLGTFGNDSSVTLPYNTTDGYLASTTGNITGIYDMSGGSFEYVAAYIDGNFGSSGFTDSTIESFKEKYFDVYNANSSLATFQYRILGDATGEMGPFYNYADKDNIKRHHNNWYADHDYFVDSYYPWFNRGGTFPDGVLAGQFYFSRDTGVAQIHISSRLVLAP